MSVTFKGYGLVFIPERGRSIRFVNGEYSTDDEAGIAVLAKNWEHSEIKTESEVVVTDQEGGPAMDKPRRGRPKNV